ncbi:MAG TPA: hypothetical protein VF020_00945 [Chthoniobacterales bacterium]
MNQPSFRGRGTMAGKTSASSVESLQINGCEDGRFLQKETKVTKGNLSILVGSFTCVRAFVYFVSFCKYLYLRVLCGFLGKNLTWSHLAVRVETLILRLMKWCRPENT